ncbi:MAG: acetolactate synthase small subunit [Clostridia bacterium]
MQHTLALLVVNRPTVLSHIASLVSRRGYNIESIAAGATEEVGVTRITLVVNTEDYDIEQVIQQLLKLVDVIHVENISEKKSIQRELAMIKVRALPEIRSDIVDIVSIFRAKIVNVNNESMVVELSGESDKIDALAEVLAAHGIIEMVRTGCIALTRGVQGVKDSMPAVRKFKDVNAANDNLLNY